MLFSAVSLYWAVSGVRQQQAALEDPAWTKVKSSVAQITSFGQPVGLAVLVDARGYFLVHKSVVSGNQVTASFGSNPTVLMTLTAVDDVTQLALLKAENWIENGQTVSHVTTTTTAGSKLIAATISGPVRGEFVTDQKVGQMRPTLRYTPLSEIRLESNIGKVGGAMVFDQQGQLVGVLGATLTADENAGLGARGGGGSAVSGRAKAEGVSAVDNAVSKSAYGPQGMTVAYSLGPSVIKRVVDGLLSPDHKVKHPSVGLFFKSAGEPGARIEAVLDGTPASEAGIKVGDLVTAVDGVPIRTQVEFAMQLFNHSVGDRITVTLRRGEQELTVTVVVGAQESLD